MTIKEITIHYGGRINLGDWNSVDIKTTMTANLSEDEDSKEAARRLMEEAKEIVREAGKEAMQKRKVDLQLLFKGLPVDVRNQIMEATDAN